MKTRAQINEGQTCDLCRKPLLTFPKFYDGRTKQGPWAWMCPGCFKEHGVGLGTGKGQEYDAKTMEKTAG